jgi:glycosyltransferase involved in cell wall biosynthesis
MKALLKRLIGAHRRPVIAVIGVTLKDVRAGVAHARTSESGLPVLVWCAQPLDGAIEGCERFVSGAGAAQVRKDLTSVWPALTIVAWTGERGATDLKLVAFTVPPFRIVISNEAGGFFAATPGALTAHARRRLRDASLSAARRITDWVRGFGQWLCSTLFQSVDRAWSLLLALLGVLAKCTPPLTRFAMRRLRRDDPSAVVIQEVVPQLPRDTSGNRFTEIVIPGRAWPRRRVVDAVLNSAAHFIVFRRPGEYGNPEPLMALARRTGAFVVGRQMAYAGWRKTAICRHPFRKLQPEEVTEVVAPWSPLLVVRRDLLLHFGVPHAVTFGGALLVLCRRAAAAGLKCLITGQAGVVTQEPGMELEDAELALRLVFSRQLRKLAPAYPLSARGNVVCAPAFRRKLRSGLPRVLVVSPYLPFPLSHGGAVRMYNLCRAMSGEVDFVLACFREASETVRYEELHEVFREVHVVDIDEKYPDAFLPRQVVEYRNSAMAELIRGKCLSGQVDIVQLEYTQMAEYGDLTGAVPVILVEHDLTFTLHQQLAATLGTAAARKQYDLWKAFERSALQRSNAVWTMSDRDKGIALEHGASRRGTVVVPNGVDLQRFQPVRRQTQERTLLFVGSFRHLPNLLAFQALREIIMPQVWKVFPDARLNVIAGPHYERAADAARKRDLLAPDSRIRIQGFVEDVRPAYRECDIAVIPLPVSAGTNIKLMEAMACGRAVVSTAVGCQGLDLQDEQDLLIREVGPEFAEAAIRLLQDENLRLGIASKARRTAEERFGWKGIAAAALQTYSELVEHAKETSLRE